MSPEMHLMMRVTHIMLGFGGFVLGSLTLALPKFGRAAALHRWSGRVYGVCMLAMAGLSVPLSLRRGDYFLLTIGLLTLSWVAGGWIALGLRRRALREAKQALAANLLLTHIALMGSSYIGAWTAFLVNVRPLGTGLLVFWLYALGPTLIGTLLIRRTTRRYARTAQAQLMTTT